jgi:invasion protein IalB
MKPIMQRGGFFDVTRARGRSILAGMALAGAIAPMLVGDLAAQGAPQAWRVECTGDGKALDCRAIQLMVRDRQLIMQIAVRYDSTTKAPAMSILLPLGLNLTEPVLIKVDNGAPERQPIQTCDNTGCLVAMPIGEKLLAAMRSGAEIKITVQDASKKPIEMALPLLGFAVAYDKAK